MSAHAQSASSPRRSAEKVLWQGHPSWKGMLGFQIKWQAVALFVTVIAGAIWHLGHLSTFKFVLVLLVANALPIGIGMLKRHFSTFTVTTKGIRDERGILRHASEAAPIARINQVTVRQSLMERILDVGTLDFDTAADTQGDLFVWRGIANPKRVERYYNYADQGWDEDEPEDDDRPRGRREDEDDHPRRRDDEDDRPRRRDDEDDRPRRRRDDEDDDRPRRQDGDAREDGEEAVPDFDHEDEFADVGDDRSSSLTADPQQRRRGYIAED